MSYVDEVIDLVVKKNPAEPEFHQAVKEVLESLRVVIENIIGQSARLYLNLTDFF